MRLCEIVMAGSPVQEGVSWQRADSSWTWAWVPVWSQIEVDIGIVTACLPCLSPLLRLAWSEVGVKSRTMTPSMVTLPKYSGSWGSVDTVTGEVEKVDEKVEIEDVGLSEKQLPALPEYVEKTPKGEKKILGSFEDPHHTAYIPKVVESAWYDWWEKEGFFKPEYNSPGYAEGKNNEKGRFVIPM